LLFNYIFWFGAGCVWMSWYTRILIQNFVLWCTVQQVFVHKPQENNHVCEEIIFYWKQLGFYIIKVSPSTVCLYCYSSLRIQGWISESVLVLVPNCAHAVLPHKMTTSLKNRVWTFWKGTPKSESYVWMLQVWIMVPDITTKWDIGP
jgi:hypothetical protein